jgi:hypothetical protein
VAFITRIKRWGWLIGFSVIVIGVVSIAYIETPNAEPLDGVGTLASLLLTVFLVYIYSRQNTILKNQEEILEEQRETQEAADVNPKIHRTQTNYSGDNITVAVTNNGSGPAYDVYLTTEIEVPNNSEIQGGIWKHSITQYLPEEASESIQSPLEFSVSSSQSNIFEVLRSRFLYSRESLEKPIRDMNRKQSGDITWVSGYIFNNSDLDIGEEMQVRIDVSIIYYDSLENEHEHPIDYFTLNFNGLVSAVFEEKETRSIRPELEITEIGTFGNQKYHDENMLGFNIINKNGVTSTTASSISAHSFLRIEKASGDQDIQEYLDENRYELQISGTELSTNFHCPEKLVPGEDGFHGYAYRVTVNGKEKTVSELCEELIANNIHIPIKMGLRLKYEDSIGESHSTEEIIKGIYIGDKLPGHIPDHRYVQSNDPLELADLA